MKANRKTALSYSGSILLCGVLLPGWACAATGTGGNGQTTWYVNFVGTTSTIYDPSALVIALNSNTGLDQLYTTVGIGDEVAQDAFVDPSAPITFSNPSPSTDLTPVGVIIAGVYGGTTFGPGGESYAGPTNSTGVVLGASTAVVNADMLGDLFPVMVANFAPGDTNDTEVSVITGIQNSYQGLPGVYSDTFFQALAATVGANVPPGSSGEYASFTAGAADGTFAVSTTPLPEPGTVSLMAFGGMALLSRRRR